MDEPAPRYHGVLSDQGRGYVAGILPSIGIHLLMVLSVLAANALGDRDHDPLFDKDIYMVSTVVLPKADGLPDKLTAPPLQPDPGDSGTVEEPPVRPDEMVLPTPTPEDRAEPPEERTPKPEPEPKTPEPRRPSRDDLVASAADESSEFHFETDPDGEEGAEPAFQRFEGVALSAYQRRLVDRIKDNWLPGSMRGKYVVASANIDMTLRTVVSFSINDAGAFGGPFVSHRSGDAIYDQSCLTAVTRTRRFDAPPQGEPRNIEILFDPSEKQ